MDDLPELRALLRGDCEDVARTLLGEPSHSGRKQWRWGARGSLSLKMSGPKRGLWVSHENEQGSDLLGLIQHVRKCSFRDALTWTRDRFGLSTDRDAEERRRASAEADARERVARQKAKREADADRAAGINAARQLFGEAMSIEGTPAEIYLVQTRCIPRPEAGWPSGVIRYHPGTMSLIVAATTAGGDIQAAQRVRLTPGGRKVDDGRPVKLSRGPQDGAWVRLPGAGDAGPLLLAEGPETGITAWAATGHATWISLGTMGKIEPPIGRHVVACADDDKRFSPGAKRVRDALGKWRKAGLSVVAAHPWPVRRGDKSDLNDVMQVAGADAVRARIDLALHPVATAVDRVPIEDAREQLAAAVRRFGDAAREWAQGKPVFPGNGFLPDDDTPILTWWEDIEPESPRPSSAPEPRPEKGPPPVHGIGVDVGVGKSVAARRYAAELLVKLRTSGSKKTIAIAVPTHQLGDEQVAAFLEQPIAIKYGLTAAVWRGREARDPEAAEPGAKMCRNLEAVKLAQEAAADVQTAVCVKKLGTGKGAEIAACPFFAECAYQRQRARKPDLTFVAHEMLFGEKPNGVGNLAVVVVDEAAWRDGLEGADGHPLELPLDVLEKPVSIPDQVIGSDRLNFLRSRAAHILRGMTAGPLVREGFTEELTDAAAGEAYALEWQRWIDPQMHPRMSLDDRKAAAAAARVNKTIRREALFWRGLKAMLAAGGAEQSGWLSLGESDDGSRVVQIKHRREVREGWQVPTLIMDALLDPELLRPYWPQIEATASLRVETPHMRVRQVVDRAYAKSMLAPLSGDQAATAQEEARRRERNLRQLRAVLWREARQHAPGRVLVVCQKAVEEALEALGPVPVNVELAHHNDVAGRDEWRDVSGLIVVGRTLPGPGAVSRIAEALTGSAVDLLEPWYERGDGARQMADGTTIAAEVERHPDPLTEAIRWQICEGELLQIIGRCRAVNRTAADPVDVLILTDVPLPLRLHETLGAVELTAGPDDLMLAEGGVAFENARHAATAYPALWPNWEAARKTFMRAGEPARSGTSPYNDYHRELSHSSVCGGEVLIRVGYQVAGAGSKPCVALVDPFAVDDVVSALREMLGPLSWFRRENSDDPLPPDKPPRGRRKPDGGDVGQGAEPPAADGLDDTGPEPRGAARFPPPKGHEGNAPRARSNFVPKRGLDGGDDLTGAIRFQPLGSRETSRRHEHWPPAASVDGASTPQPLAAPPPEVSRRHDDVPPCPIDVEPGPARLAAWWRAAQAQQEARAPPPIIPPVARDRPEARAP